MRSPAVEGQNAPRCCFPRRFPARACLSARPFLRAFWGGRFDDTAPPSRALVLASDLAPRLTRLCLLPNPRRELLTASGNRSAAAKQVDYQHDSGNHQH